MVEFRSKLDSSKSRALTSWTFKKFIWLWLLLSVALIAFGIIGIITKEDSADVAAGVGIIVLGIIITPVMYLLIIFIQKRNDKATVFISSDTEEIYTFDEQYITLTQTRKDMFSSTMKARYSYIYKAYEDRSYYYFYISKMQTHVIDKGSITQGTLEELNRLLKANLGDKFKQK